MIDELCKKNTTNEGCKRCGHSPDHGPCKNSYKSIRERDRCATAGKHRLEIVKSNPCKQVVWWHMIFIIIGKCHTGHKYDRDDIHQNDTDTWQSK